MPNHCWDTSDMRIDYSVSEIVELTGLTQGSNAVGRLVSGKTVFVGEGVPGDVVEIELIKEAKRHCEAKILRIIEPSAQRVTPACPFYAMCGGCPWMQVSYEGQLLAKRANVVEQLVRIGNKNRAEAEELVGETIASPRQLNYRNKIELHATYGTHTYGSQNPKSQRSKAKSSSNPRQRARLSGAETTPNAKSSLFRLGFHQSESHTIVETKTCPVAAKAIEKSPASLRGALRYAQGNQDLGIFRVGVRSSAKTKATEIALWTTPGPFPRAHIAQILQDSLKATSVVRVMADPGKARKIKGVEVLAGKGYWEEKLLGLTYKVSAPSFFQVNSEQAETMIKLVLEGLAVGPESYCADLYCGAGTFTLPLAEHCGEVFAVESQASSVRDLRRNLEINNLFAEVIGGDSARELPELGELDGLVVDPPRAGLAPSVPADIAAAAAKRFAYVSCDPSTWARDVARIEAYGYRLVSTTPVDLFPQTYHIETVSIFER